MIPRDATDTPFLLGELIPHLEKYQEAAEEDTKRDVDNKMI